MKKYLLLLLLGPMLVGNALADRVVVVVNPANTASFSQADIRNLFLGRTRTFPDGKPAVPIALKEGSPSRSRFNQDILHKDETRLRAYWVELIFTGKALPPREVDSEEELRRLVAEHPDYIGYLDEKMAGDGVKVITVP